MNLGHVARTGSDFQSKFATLHEMLILQDDTEF
jgi:hypothetical protein